MPVIANGVSWETDEGDLAVRLCALSNAERITVDTVIQTLKHAGIAVVIDETALSEALRTRSGEWTLVAKGAAPTPPVHGYLEYLVDPRALDRTPQTDESGNIDYKDLKLFLNVEERDELVRKHDPIHGKPGFDVYGKPIPPEEALRVRLPVGEGIKIVEGGCLAVASIGGAVAMVDNRLMVMKIFHVTGDVNYKTGNIDFNGNVDINRDVLAGFSVKADGDVIVRGVVEAAQIEAKGDIHIFGGFQGDGKGVLKAGGDIRIQYANDGTIEAGKDLFVRSLLLNCNVRAGQSVRIEGGNGVLAGGQACAGETIESTNMGSEAGVKTILQIGKDQDLPSKIQAAQEIIVALLKVKRSIDNRKREIEKMRADLHNAWEGKVVCHKNLFPGVIVRFPGTEFEVKDSMYRKTITCSKGRIANEPAQA